MARPRKWTDTQRADALDVFARDGLAAAHHATGIPKGTISYWATEAGITERSETKNNTAAQHATAAASEGRRRQLDESRDRRAVMLAGVAELALGRTLDLLRAVDPETGKPAEIPVRDLVGIWTRAGHDLALITGEATENHDVHVTFNVPPPSTSPPPIVHEDDLPALAR